MQTQFPTNLQTIWEAIGEHIAAHVSKDTFQRWFQAITMTIADENEITLTVPNNIYQLWIESNYIALLQTSVASVLGGPRTIHFVTAAEPVAKPASPSLTAGEDIEEFGIPLRNDAPLPAGYKKLADLKTIRPTIAEIIKGIPELTEKWRDTFGV